MVNIAFAYGFQDGRKSILTGFEVEQNKYVGPSSTIMRMVTHKDGDLASYFDKFDATQGAIDNSSSKHILNDNHTDADHEGKIKNRLPPKQFFGFIKTYEKLTNG